MLASQGSFPIERFNFVENHLFGDHVPKFFLPLDVRNDVAGKVGGKQFKVLVFHLCISEVIKWMREGQKKSHRYGWDKGGAKKFRGS